MWWDVLTGAMLVGLVVFMAYALIREITDPTHRPGTLDKPGLGWLRMGNATRRDSGTSTRRTGTR